MPTTTINLSLSKKLLDEADKVAKQEYRNRSELMREALRSYIAARQQLRSIYEDGVAQAKKLNLKPEDVSEAIASYRRR